MADSKDPDPLAIPKHTTIETERLHLRTFYISDAEAVLPIISSAEVMRWTTHPDPITEIPAARKWVSDRAVGKDVFNFVMILKSTDARSVDSGKVIGIIGSRRGPEVGYMVDPRHAGKGYASEALRALIPAMFARMPAGEDGFNYIEAVTASNNTPSRRVMEKCGLVLCQRGANDPPLPVVPRHEDLVAYRIARPGYILDGAWVVKSESGETTTEKEILPQRLEP